MADEQGAARNAEAHSGEGESKTENDFERDEEADLAEELLVAKATGEELVEAEEVLETIDAQEADVEALGVAESAAGEIPAEQLAAEEDVELALDDAVRVRLEGRLDGDRSFAGHAELELQPGPRVGEFVCRGCYLTRMRSQLADPVRLLCRDCANNSH